MFRRTAAAPLLEAVMRGRWVTRVSCRRFLERLSYTHLGQRPDHGFFSLGELNNQAVLTPEATEILLSQGPNFFNNGSARAGQADDLASFQVG